MVFLRLGLTSFGGPVAHLGYFHEAFVTRKKWLSEKAYADLVALCQFMPGPASSQVGFGIGLIRGGLPGACAAWFAFTMPSAVAMIAFAMGVAHVDQLGEAGWVRGLKAAAVAVVAHAIWTMAKKLWPTRLTTTFGLVSATLVLALGTAWAQVAVIAMGAAGGALLLRNLARESNNDDANDANDANDADHTGSPVSRTQGLVALALFFLLLFALPGIAASGAAGGWVDIADRMVRTGSLVFGGGHVVLPLLEAETVPRWLDSDTFLAGYGAAQAVPGPLFTFSAFLGTIREGTPNGIAGGLIALVSIFLPAVLLITGVFPFWEALRRNPMAQAALAGANAVVVGLLVAALYHPIFTGAITRTSEFVVALLAFGLLASWKAPAWLVVALAATAGFFLL